MLGLLEGEPKALGEREKRRSLRRQGGMNSQVLDTINKPVTVEGTDGASNLNCCAQGNALIHHGLLTQNKIGPEKRCVQRRLA